MIRDHRFEPRTETWYRTDPADLPPNEYLCADCGLAESAHETARGVLPLALKFRCPACVEAGAEKCGHR